MVTYKYKKHDLEYKMVTQLSTVRLFLETYRICVSFSFLIFKLSFTVKLTTYEIQQVLSKVADGRGFPRALLGFLPPYMLALKQRSNK